MCIIAVKPWDVEPIKEEIIREMFRKNDHGAGYMIQKSGSNMIKINKGFFTVEELLEAMKNENIDRNDVFIVHFRIATSGSKEKSMCHPFIAHPLAEKANAVQQVTNLTCFAHNGIIRDLNGSSKDYSDTSLFAQQYISDKAIIKNLYESEAIQAMVDKFIDGSRMVFLHPTKGLLYFGDWEESEGVMYSNTGYKISKFNNFGSGYWDGVNNKWVSTGSKGKENAYSSYGAGWNKSTFEEEEEDDYSRFGEGRVFPIVPITQKSKVGCHETCTYCGMYREIASDKSIDGYEAKLCTTCDGLLFSRKKNVNSEGAMD